MVCSSVSAYGIIIGLFQELQFKKEMWKAPIKEWNYEMYEKRHRKAELKAKRKKQNKSNNDSI